MTYCSFYIKINFIKGGLYKIKHTSEKNKKKEPTSPRLKRIICFEFITIFIMIACLIAMFLLIDKNYSLVSTILEITETSSLVLIGLLLILYNKEFKRITNGSIEYYKKLLPHYFLDMLIFGLGFIIGIVIFSILENQNIDLSILTSIYVAIFSLIFVLFLFILPTYKKYIASSRKILTNKYQKIKSHSDYIKLKTFQGKIYKNNMSFNHLSLSMIIATIVFCITLIMLCVFGNAPISYFILFTSIFFDLIFICRLAVLIKRNYNSDLEQLESMINKQNQKLEKTIFIKENKDTSSKK